MSLIWPIAIPVAAVAACVVVAVIVVACRRHRADGDPVFGLEDDLGTEHASKLLHRWRRLNRTAGVLLSAALCLAVVLVARPARMDAALGRSRSRDIVLCLDVSGSTLPYDREVIDTYRRLLDGFDGERIGMSIFNSTSRTVFPLTDDYDMVATQLDEAERILRGVESQSDIDKMSDSDYQRISDWLEGTQNRTDATSLIGDGLVSCAAMLPGFTYGSESGGDRVRSASIVLTTDNVVSGTPTYTLAQALKLTDAAGIDVDGLYSGPRDSETDDDATSMRTLIESRGGVFLTREGDATVDELVRTIDRRQSTDRTDEGSAPADAPGWWTVALLVVAAGWLLVAWRLRR